MLRTFVSISFAFTISCATQPAVKPVESVRAASTKKMSSAATKNTWPAPKLISIPAAPFPEEARAAGISGKVTLGLWVNADGSVRLAKHLNHPEDTDHPLLIESALETVKKARFDEALPNERGALPYVRKVKYVFHFEIAD